jgi:hypothetical protein
VGESWSMRGAYIKHFRGTLHITGYLVFVLVTTKWVMMFPIIANYLRWSHGTLYPQKLAHTSPTSGGRSVGIVRSRTQTMEFFFSSCEIEAVIRFLHSGLTNAEIHLELCAVYCQHVISQRTGRQCCRIFRNRRTNFKSVAQKICERRHYKIYGISCKLTTNFTHYFLWETASVV